MPRAADRLESAAYRMKGFSYMLHLRRFHAVSLSVLVAMVLGFSGPVRAADRDRIEAFLAVTGFDVALESIRLSADSAPDMLGMQPEDFGSEWSRLVREVFATDAMHAIAIDILAETLDDELLDHGAAFYASDLGQRLVEAENASHMAEDDSAKADTGAEIIAKLEKADPQRIDLLHRLNRASDVEDSSIASIQEVQIRFLMAAAAAGVIELRMDEPDLREAMRSQEPQLREAIRESSLKSAAFTYQSFTDDELETYIEALEDPRMQKLYALMNAVQFEVMANRYEVVANRLSQMQPSQEL